MGKTLNEVFAVVPNSFQQYSGEVRTALRDNPPEGFGRDDWGYVEALIGDAPEQALIECYKSGGDWKYYLFDIAFEDGTVQWSNQREVEVEAALKIKSVMERRMLEVVEAPQTPVVDVSDAEIVVESEDGKQYASVEIAQKADVKNRNNRIYPKEVLQDAVERLKDRIKASGPIPMETMHRDERYLGDVCAIIHEVHFNESTGVVVLPKIEMLGTSSGKDVMTLLDAELELQVSQRGYGVSHEEIDPNSGLRVQIMDYLVIEGWDMVWNGDASVEEAAFALNERVQQQQQPGAEPTNEGGEEPTPEPTPQQQQQQQQPPTQSRQPSSYFSGRSNERGNPTQGNPPQQQQQQQQEPPPQQQQQGEPQQQQMIGKEVVSLVKTALQQELGQFRNQFESEMGEVRRKDFVEIANGVFDEVLAKHPRFTDKQKEAIKSGVNLHTLYDQVESLDVSSIARVLTPVLEAEIEQADKIVATNQVNGWGLPSGNPNVPYINNAGGVTYNEVINDAHVSRIFDGHNFDHTVEAIIDEMTRGNRLTPQNPDGNWVMPKDHYGMKPLAVVMDRYYRERGGQLAVHETAAADIGIPVNQVSMLLVPVVWRMVTAFRMAQLHPMTLLVEDIPIERWTGQQASVSDWERWNALDPGDNNAIPESVLDYEHYRLASGYQPQHVKVTPRARATTKNTVMNPTVRSGALAAREIVNQNDLTLWRALIMEVMKLDAVKVETWTATTRVASTNVYTLRDGLIPYEWIVTEDGNDNVAKSGLVRNFPANGETTAALPSGVTGTRKLQPLELREGGGDNTPLEYRDDYTVDWVKGQITLTTAGAAKVTTNGVQARYSYATNIAVWDATVPSGSTFVDHLYDLRFKIADLRTLVKTRHYEPECLAWNYGLMDKISGGGNFTNEGGNIAQVIDPKSTVLKYAGSESIDSTAIPEEYIICSQKMSILFGMHTPFTLTGQHFTDNTGNRHYFGEQFAGMGVPAPEKAAICIVKNVP